MFYSTFTTWFILTINILLSNEARSDSSNRKIFLLFCSFNKKILIWKYFPTRHIRANRTSPSTCQVQRKKNCNTVPRWRCDVTTTVQHEHDSYRADDSKSVCRPWPPPPEGGQPLPRPFTFAQHAAAARPMTDRLGPAKGFIYNWNSRSQIAISQNIG